MRAHVRYACAIAAVPAAILLRFALQPLIGSGTPYVALFPVTVAVALIAGMGPAIVTGVLGSIATDYFFIEPLYSIDLDVVGLSRMAVLTLTSAFVGYFGEVLRAARAKAERQALELRESEQRLSTVFRASPTGIFITRLADGLFLDVNDAYLQITGYSADEVIGHTSPELNIWVDPEDHERIVNLLRGQGRIENSETRFHRKNGEIVDLLYSALPLERGGEPCILGALTNITERKRMEEELRKSREELEIHVQERTRELAAEIAERKKAEESLRSASLYARGLLEASLDPLVTISPEGKITDVNKATELATGLSRDALVGSDFSTYFNDPQKARAGYRRVLSEGLVRDYPLTVRHVSGRTMDVLYNATVYRNQAGQLEGVFAAARDITDRKAAEERQRVTTSLLQLFARKTSRKEYLDAVVQVIRTWSGCTCVGVRLKDDEGNLRYESSVGLDREFLAKENALRIGQDSCLCVRAVLQQPQEQDKDLLTPGGSFCCNDSPAFLEGLAEQERKDYRGHCMKRGLRSIALVPVRYHDETLGVIHLADHQTGMASTAKIRFIETTVSPLIGEAVHRFNAEAELEEYRQHLEELVEQRTGELEEANRQLQSEMAHRQQIADDLARSNKDLEQFAYVASHDLQEPLRAVSGFVGLLRLQLQGSLDAKKTEYMNFAVDGVARMQTLINGLLEYSRVGIRGGPSEATDSRAALDHALLGLQTSIEESAARVTADPLPTVHIDPVQMVQLLQNLIGNAIKFRGKRSPEIHIAATRELKAWQFAVTDNGIGIEPQYAERIFLIFQRLHTRREYPGTGIGLAICKKIVERHGGRIWVESTPGRGSTFYFTVPDTGEA